MLYKFKSKATGDVIMLGQNGDQVMRIVGREPAAKGIFDLDAMGVVLTALEAAVAVEEAASVKADAGVDNGAEAAAGAGAVSLRSRVWPLVEMLRRAQRAGEPVVWGV